MTPIICGFAAMCQRWTAGLGGSQVPVDWDAFPAFLQFRKGPKSGPGRLRRLRTRGSEHRVDWPQAPTGFGSQGQHPQGHTLTAHAEMSAHGRSGL